MNPTSIAGIGLGGEFGIGMALAAEAWPAKHRARASSYVALGWQAGVLSAVLITPALLPHIGWRGMFLLGILPAFVAWFIRHRLHEPEVFVRKTDNKASTWSSFKLLMKDKATSKVSAGIVVFNIGRAVGGFGSVVIGAVASVYSFQMAIALLAAIYVLDILATLFLIPELKGKVLE